MILLGISALGALGACIRYYISSLSSWDPSKGFPYATMVINIIGSFLLGLCWGMRDQMIISELVWQLVGVGLLGAFTTFSTFSYEWLQLMLHKRYQAAAMYVIGTLAISILLACFSITLVV